MNNKLSFLKVYLSPFKAITPKFYFGKVLYGTPVFLPRVWKKYTPAKAILKAREPHTNYMKDWTFGNKYDYYLKCTYSVPKKIGFDFVPLWWKTKWSSTDFRFEFSPLWSFVFFGWQAAIIWVAPHTSHYWESWLCYEYATDKTKTVRERLEEAKEINPNIWTTYRDGKKETVNYWTKVLKKKWL